MSYFPLIRQQFKKIKNVWSIHIIFQKSAIHKQTPKIPPDGRRLEDFMVKTHVPMVTTKKENIPYLSNILSNCGSGRTVFFDVYGCQMNVSDTDVAWTVLKDAGFTRADKLESADVVLVMTCAIREGAESKIWNKLEYLKGLKNVRSKKKNLPPMRIGILGCMAERLKHKLLEEKHCVDVVAGPDAYRDLPRLLSLTDGGMKAVNVLLSLEETYADVTPVRLNQDAVTAFVSIMRGCDNMCTFCIVPFTRGRERSRPMSSIVDEVAHLSAEGVKEITLLGYEHIGRRRGKIVDQLIRNPAKSAKRLMLMNLIDFSVTIYFYVNYYQMKLKVMNYCQEKNGKLLFVILERAKKYF